MQTTSKEDYLRAMYILQEERDSIRLTDIATYLGISKPSVNGMLKQLAKDRLIIKKHYGKIQLTELGMDLAKTLTAKHRLIEMFLQQALHVPEDKLHSEAHKLEHAFSTYTTKKLQKFLGNPKTDPHGKPIPALR